MLFAVESLIADNCAVLKIFHEQRRGRMIAHLAACEDKFRREPQQSITDGVDLGIEAASGAPDGLILPAFRAVGMLMNFAVGAVFEDSFGTIAYHKPFMEPIEETIEREAIEVLIYGKPTAEYIRKPAPRTAINHDVPQSVKMLVERCNATACMDNVVVSVAPFFALIFLAARGAAPACSDDNLSWDYAATFIIFSLKIKCLYAKWPL
jgi:hypothetical protein